MSHGAGGPQHCWRGGWEKVRGAGGKQGHMWTRGSSSVGSKYCGVVSLKCINEFLIPEGGEGEENPSQRRAGHGEPCVMQHGSSWCPAPLLPPVSPTALSH